MKFFAFILAFLVLLLSVVPCADESFMVKAGKVKTEIAAPHSQQEPQEHNDTCSPFCQCTCCSGFSINHLFAAVSSLVAFHRKSYTSYLPGNLIEYSSPIWQPPQLHV